MEFIYEPEFWVAVSFFIFIGVLVYFGVHMKVVSALDARALLISQELDEARRLPPTTGASWAMSRRRWTTSLRSPPSKRRPLTAETRQSLKEHFDRRIKLAEEKIARAEMEAVREFRSVAVDAAIAAAQNLIAAKLTPDRAKKLVSESIKALKSNLN